MIVISNQNSGSRHDCICFVIKMLYNHWITFYNFSVNNKSRVGNMESRIVWKSQTIISKDFDYQFPRKPRPSTTTTTTTWLPLAASDGLLSCTRVIITIYNSFTVFPRISPPCQVEGESDPAKPISDDSSSEN